jgi:protein ImuB
VWFPNWPIQRRISLRSELKQRAFVLFTESARGLQIAVCSETAVARGIRPGISLAEARGLCVSSNANKSSPAPRPVTLVGKQADSMVATAVSESEPPTGTDLVSEPTDPVADREALQQLARWCQIYSPLVGVEEAETPEALLLDITGCEVHFGGELGLAQLLGSQLAFDGYHSRIAIADTLGAAWAMAHFGVSTPHPVAVIPAGKHVSTIRALPVAGLRLSPRILETLNKLDIRNIGQLENLPRTTLPARFGKELLLRLDQAWGTAHELILPEHVFEPIHAVWNSEEPLSNQETLEFVQQGLLDQVLGKLQPQRVGIREFQCLFTGSSDRLTLTLRLIQPSLDRRHLWDLLRLEWERQERQFHKSSSPAPRCMTEGMTSIRLEVLVAAPLKVRQQTLFDLDPDQKRAQAFRQFVERLSSRLGNQAVLRPQSVPDAQPEYACDYVNWEETTPSSTIAETDSWEAPLVRSRPLRLSPIPERIRVYRSTASGPPQRIWRGVQQLAILRSWGPERIETGWWREHDVRRDYYRVETDQGQHFWIFQCLLTTEWFLHGAYE